MALPTTSAASVRMVAMATSSAGLDEKAAMVDEEGKSGLGDGARACAKYSGICPMAI